MKQLRVITFSIISHQLVHSPRHKLQPSSWTKDKPSWLSEQDSNSGSICRPRLGQHINQHACRVTPSNTSPPLSQHFTDTWPALRSFVQLLLLSSIFSTQLLLIIFSSPLRGAFSGRHFSSYVFSSSSLLYRSLVTFKSSSFWGLLLSEVCYFRGAKNYVKRSNDCTLFLPQDGIFISRPCDISQLFVA